MAVCVCTVCRGFCKPSPDTSYRVSRFALYAKRGARGVCSEAALLFHQFHEPHQGVAADLSLPLELRAEAKAVLGSRVRNFPGVR